jgi:uncharacterized protein
VTEPAKTSWITPGRTLDPRVVRVWTAATVIATAVGVAGACAAAAVFAIADVGGAAIGAVVAAAVVAVVGGSLAAVVPRRRFARFRWDVTDNGVLVRHGWLWEVLHIVPHTRIQAVDARSGPLARRQGLATLHLRTASATGSPRIPGLDRAVAEVLAAEIARRAGTEDAT